MTPGDRIARLEGLLDRVQKNTAKPRVQRAAAPAPAPAPVAAAPVPQARISAAPVAPGPRTPAPPTPVPAVAAPPTPPPPAPPPLEASIPPFRPEPGSSVQERPTSIPPEELSEDDLVEVTTIPPAPAAASSVPATDEEEPPASSRRSKVVAESLDQAIANAASQADEHEVPIHTPPPESGPQEAVLPVAFDAPRTPEFGELSPPPSLGPTPEQLGETIDLEEAPAIEIEVAGLAGPEPKTERPVEELEVALPRAEMPSGTYDVEVSEPERAAPAAPTVSAGSERIVPEVTARPAETEAEITHVVRVTEKAPDTFAELLETSLRL